MNENIQTPAPVAQPSPGLPVPAGWAPLEIAIAGYMGDRNALVAQLKNVVPAYDNHAAVRKMVGEEIDRIDKVVASLLKNAMQPNNKLSNSGHQPTP